MGTNLASLWADEDECVRQKYLIRGTYRQQAKAPGGQQGKFLLCTQKSLRFPCFSRGSRKSTLRECTAFHAVLHFRPYQDGAPGVMPHSLVMQAGRIADLSMKKPAGMKEPNASERVRARGQQG
jgi:hypothetical protein